MGLEKKETTVMGSLEMQDYRFCRVECDADLPHVVVMFPRRQGPH